MRVVVIHGPGEESLAEEVCLAAAPAQPVAMRTTIEELMGLLAHARCVVAADSGPLHLAAALGRPVVGLYGPTDPARNGPFVPGAVVLTKRGLKRSVTSGECPILRQCCASASSSVADAAISCLKAPA